MGIDFEWGKFLFTYRDQYGTFRFLNELNDVETLYAFDTKEEAKKVMKELPFKRYELLVVSEKRAIALSACDPEEEVVDYMEKLRSRRYELGVLSALTKEELKELKKINRMPVFRLLTRIGFTLSFTGEYFTLALLYIHYKNWFKGVYKKTKRGVYISLVTTALVFKFGLSFLTFFLHSSVIFSLLLYSSLEVLEMRTGLRTGLEVIFLVLKMRT